MSGRICFICNEPNYNGNETVITVRRFAHDNETGAKRTVVWEGMICDECLNSMPELAKAVGV